MKYLTTSLFLIICCTSSVLGNGLYLTNHYLRDQVITDVCEWKNELWVSTESRIYKISDNGLREVSITLEENDRITSLYSGSSFTLICGTFQGNVIFITEDKNDYCHAEWNLKDVIKDKSFYVEEIMQTNQGLWLGTLEHGVYLFDPFNHSLTNFPLDFNEDSIGLNVDGLMSTSGDITWAEAQDGLYLIMNIFGKENSLQYVKSNRFKTKPYDIDFHDGHAFIAHQKKSSNYLSMVKLGENHFDVRRLKKTPLPDGKIVKVDVKDLNDFWILGPSSLTHAIDSRFIEYPVVDENGKRLRANNFLRVNNKLYVGTDHYGLLEYSLEEPKKERISYESAQLFVGEPEFENHIELDMVYFQPGDSNLLPVSTHQLNALVKVLKEHPEISLELIGHTAKDGPNEYLINLSTSRAVAVRKFLVQNGVDRSRISTLGQGATDLKVPDRPKSPENRRVEIVLHK